MLLYHMILLLLSWPCVRGIGDADVQDDALLDQIAIASESVRTIATRDGEKSPTDLSERSKASLDETTIHYENSNGFVPMTSTAPSVERDYHGRASQRNRNAKESIGIESDKLENDLVYSSEARIFLDLPGSGMNRRSFESQEGRTEFELLKVKNDTPAIANYNDFYANVQSVVLGNSGNDEDNDEDDDEDDGYSDENEEEIESERKKRIEGYVANYGVGRANERDDFHNRYFSYGSAKEEKKVPSNYHRQSSVNYNGHGTSVPKYGASDIASAFARSSYRVDGSSTTGVANYDSVDSASKNRYRFSKPVVVAEPKDYKVDSKFAGEATRIASSIAASSKSYGDVHSAMAEPSNLYDAHEKEARGRSYDKNDDDSSDASNDSMDSMEYTERPRRFHKSKRRPYASTNSRRLPKEHRGGSQDDSYEFEEQRKRPSFTRSKGHRQRTKSSWTDDDTNHSQDDSTEERPYESRAPSNVEYSKKMVKSQKNGRASSRPSNAWNQISPNIEISHSSGIEIDQVEKPKLVVPVKIIPVANFDHATALGNSQGFDVSNAVYQNVATATTIGTLDGSASQQQNSAKNFRNVHNVGISTPVPDIIVGQNTFQNPTHTVLLPQMHVKNKILENPWPRYVSSTVAPVLAVTPNIDPTLQSVPLQHLPNAVTARPTYSATTGSAANVQQLAVNQMHPAIPHFIVPQPTVQTMPNILQTAIPLTNTYNVQVNPHGLHGQNVIANGNLHLQNVPTISGITASPAAQSIAGLDFIATETQNKKNSFSDSAGKYLAQLNDNSYYASSQQSQQFAKAQPSQDNFYQVIKDGNYPSKPKNYIQAQIVPAAILHPVSPLSNVNIDHQQLLSGQQNNQGASFLFQRPRDQVQQYVKLSNIDNAMQQLQLQMQLQRGQPMKNNKLSGMALMDNFGSQTSNNVNLLNTGPDDVAPHLPKLGTKSVEIMNPNIKPSPVDLSGLSPLIESMHQYPTAIVTTPISIFSTTGFVTARPPVLSTSVPPESIGLQSFVDSLTEIGSKGNPSSSIVADSSTSQNQERPTYNPINFVPNIDIVKNQNNLNNKLQSPENLQQSLNLVPLMPGGNFFKPSFAAQSELIAKPKLATDLAKYAEEMFRESLRTMYNSQKWNHDRRYQNNSDTNDIVKLKNELLKLKASLPDSKQNKEILEAHQSENKFQTTESIKSSNSANEQKKADPLLATLEKLLKSHPSEPIGIHYGDRPNHGHDRPFPVNKDNIKNNKHPRDFLTPPKLNSFAPKRPVHSKRTKKRPSPPPSRYKNPGHYERPSSRKRPNNISAKSHDAESSASNVNFNVYEGSHHHHHHHHDKDYADRQNSHLDAYPTFTTSTPEKEDSGKNNQDTNKYDINHPRMHNLLGLLMKTKQLPPGSSQSYFNNTDQLRQFFEDEKRRLQQQFYDDTLRNYFQKKSDISSHQLSRSNAANNDRKNYPGKRVL